MLSWLVRRVVKDAWFVVVTWAVLAIVLLPASLGIFGGGGLFERLEAGTLSVGGTESAQGDQIISVLSGDGRIVTLMVKNIDISSPETQAQVAEALGPAHTELASLAGATNVFDPFNVRRSLFDSAAQSFGSDRLDGFLVVVSIDPNGTAVASPDDQAYAAEVDRMVERVEDRLKQIPGELSSISPQVSGIVSDDALKTRAINDQMKRDLVPDVLIAVLVPLVMMILIGIWLHSKSSVKQWNAFMDRQMKTVTATGSFVSMFALSFLAVFREGAETILFYVGIIPRITTANFLIGIALAIAVLVIIAVAMTKASHYIKPHRIFFILTWLIYALAFKMLGVSIHALQLTNMMSNHLISGFPTIDWAGIYPSWEVLIPQIIFIVIIAFVTVKQHGKK